MSKRDHYKQTSVWVPIQNLHPHQYKVIETVDDLLPTDQKTELVRDIQDRGILIALMVQEDQTRKDHYFIIDGNTRYYIAKFAHDQGDKDFATIRCDVLNDDFDGEALEVMAILNNIHRRSLNVTARHLMITRYKDKVEELINPYRKTVGSIIKYSLPSTTKQTLTSTDSLAETIIKGINAEGRTEGYIAKALGLKSPTTVTNAGKTVDAIRYKINKDGGQGVLIKRDEPNRVNRVLEELSKLPDDFGREVMRTPATRLQSEHNKAVGVSTISVPIRTVNLKGDHNDWVSSLSNKVAQEIRTLSTKYDITVVVQLKIWPKKKP